MTEEQIHIICKQYNITNYIINDDMSIDVDGDVRLHKRQLEKIPLKFNKVSGYFDCHDNKLTSLEGSPIEVGGDFYCSYNELTTLEGSPIKVDGYFWCNANGLNTLEYGPKFIGYVLYCKYNPIYEEFKVRFNNNYKLYLKYINRQKLLKQLIDD